MTNIVFKYIFRKKKKAKKNNQFFFLKIKVKKKGRGTISKVISK